MEPGCIFLGQTKASSFDSENLTAEMEVEQMPVLEYALTQSKVKSCEEKFSKNSLENVFSEMDDKGKLFLYLIKNTFLDFYTYPSIVCKHLMMY